jgi:hypothetical protein
VRAGSRAASRGRRRSRLAVQFGRYRSSALRARAAGAAMRSANRGRGRPNAVAAASSHAVVPRRRAETGPGAAWRRGLPARAGCRPGMAARAARFVSGPMAGSAVERRGGKNATGSMPSVAKRRRNWSSTTSASVPTTAARRRMLVAGARGHHRRQAGVLALREGRLDAAAAVVQDPHRRVLTARRWAARARSSLITSLGQEPTRKSVRMSGRRASSCARRDRALRWRRPARRGPSPQGSRSPKRGSAKIITPAADWMRCAQVRDPTTRKKASCILRCSQTMPVRPQKTSRCPRSRRTGRSRHGDVGPGRSPSCRHSYRRRLASRRAIRSFQRNWAALIE